MFLFAELAFASIVAFAAAALVLSLGVGLNEWAGSDSDAAFHLVAMAAGCSGVFTFIAALVLI